MFSNNTSSLQMQEICLLLCQDGPHHLQVITYGMVAFTWLRQKRSECSFYCFAPFIHPPERGKTFCCTLVLVGACVNAWRPSRC